ncbi:MAG: beta-lactamase family protein [Planctomycetes bacterium]|nr:beta-lactamase family protein [Planctomycetota bacterium]
MRSRACLSWTFSSALGALLSACALALAAPTRHASADESNVVEGELGARLDRIVQTSTQGGFWGAVLVARQDTLLLAKGYGFADYGSVPNTPASLFELASTSKMFAAAAVLKLEMQAKLRTTDPLARFFPDAPADKKGITLHHLLTHTSGIDNDTVALPYATPLGRDEMVRHVLGFPLVSKPGERFSYNNFGYALLAAVVEKASGSGFEEYVRENVFRPASMRDTGFLNDAALDARRATVRLGEGGVPAGTSLGWTWGWGYRGMGGVVSTVRDLFEWHRSLKGDRVLDVAARKKFFTPFQEHYAYGWIVQPARDGTTRQFHAGGVSGYHALLARYPEEDVFVAVLSNGACEPFALEARLFEALVPPASAGGGLEATFDLRGRKLTEFGAFEIKSGVRWEAEAKNAGILVRVVDVADGKAFAEVTLPAGTAKEFAHALDGLVDAKKVGGGGGKGVEAGVYALGRPLPPDRVWRLSGRLELRLLPQYVGVNEKGPHVDDRITLFLDDKEAGGWPLLALLDVASAEELRAALAKALGR